LFGFLVFLLVVQIVWIVQPHAGRNVC